MVLRGKRYFERAKGGRMLYCPLTLSSKYPTGCINTSCKWWVSTKGCAIPVIAREICKITGINDKGKLKENV